MVWGISSYSNSTKLISVRSNIKLWDIQEGTNNLICKKSIVVHGNSRNVIWKIILVSGTDLLIAANSDSTIVIWNYVISTRVRTFTGHGNAVYSLILFNKNVIISGSYDKTIRYWNFNTGECTKVIKKAHDDTVFALLKLSGSRFVSGSSDRTIKIWNFEGGECLKTIFADHRIFSLAFMPKKRRIISGSFSRQEPGTGKKNLFKDSKLQIHDLVTCKCIKSINDHEKGIPQIVVLPNGDFLSCSKDSTIKLFHYETFECLRTYRFFSKYEVRSICLLNNEDGDIVTGGGDKRMVLFGLKYHQERNDFNNRLSFLLDSNISDFTVKLKNDKIINCFKIMFLNQSSITNLSNKKEIAIDEDLNIDEEIIFRIMFGLSFKLDEENIFDYYVFFKELELKKHSFLMCKMAEKIESLDILIRDFISSFRKFEIVEDVCKGETYAFISGYTMVTFDRVKKILDDLPKQYYTCLEEEKLLSFIKFTTVNNVKLRYHPYFNYVLDGIDISPYSFQLVGRKAIANLQSDEMLTSRNLKVVSKDDIEFMVHKELFVLKTNFFYKMLKFPGSESRDISEKNEVKVELNGSSLELLCNYTYTGYMDTENVVLLIDLLTFALKYFETGIIKYIVEKMKRISLDEGISNFLLNSGYLFINNEVSKFFVPFWVRRIKRSKLSVLSAIVESNKAQHFKSNVENFENFKKFQKNFNENMKETTEKIVKSQEKFQIEEKKKSEDFMKEQERFMKSQKEFMDAQMKYIENQQKKDNEIEELKKELKELKDSIRKKRKREEEEEEEEGENYERNPKKLKKN